MALRQAPEAPGSATSADIEHGQPSTSATAEQPQDADEVDRLRRQLADTKRRLHQLQTLAPLGYLYLNRELAIIDSNQVMATMLDTAPRTLLGSSLLTYIADGARESCRQFLIELPADDRRRQQKTREPQERPDQRSCVV